MSTVTVFRDDGDFDGDFNDDTTDDDDGDDGDSKIFSPSRVDGDSIFSGPSDKISSNESSIFGFFDGRSSSFDVSFSLSGRFSLLSWCFLSLLLV